jgi:hypothetical protein
LAKLEVGNWPARERLRIHVGRLRVAEQLSRRALVLDAYPETLVEARALHLPGIEAAVLDAACTAASLEVKPGLAEPVCAELRRLGERIGLPGGAVAAELSWAGSRIPERLGADALDHGRRARMIAEQLGGRRRLADALEVFAIAARDAGSAEYDEELFHEALAIAHDAHDHPAAWSILFALSSYARADGRVSDEARYAREALELARDAGSPEMVADTLCRLGSAQVRAGDVGAARRLLDEARPIIGRERALDADCGTLEAFLFDVQGRYAEARAAYLRVAAQQEAAGGAAATRALDHLHVALVDYHRRDWRALVRSTDELVRFAGDNALRREWQEARLLRLIAQVELGHREDARAHLSEVRQLDDAASKMDRAWIELLIAGLDRRLGRSGGELDARLAAVIGAAVNARYRPLEFAARLERLEVLVRDRDPRAVAEATELGLSADASGFIGTAARAAELASAAR